MSDQRYSTSAWQKTRKAIVRRDGHLCRVQGPRCTGHATTVHHIVPSSQAPHLFFAEENLVSSCSACNYGGGRRTAVDNSRRRMEYLERVIE
jgi:5-methylcytosine-specific restriction endonuclease McrA